MVADDYFFLEDNYWIPAYDLLTNTIKKCISWSNVCMEERLYDVEKSHCWRILQSRLNLGLIIPRMYESRCGGLRELSQIKTTRSIELRDIVCALLFVLVGRCNF